MKNKISFIFVLILCFSLNYINAESYNRNVDFGTWQHHHGVTVRQELIKQANLDGKFFCSYTGDWHLIQTAQVDHIIPVAWAYLHGANKWTHTKRVQFYNDSQNLILVYGPVNEAKGDSPPDKWFPPRKEYRVQYLTSWITVCRKYDLECDFEMLSKMIDRNLTNKDYE